MNIKSWQEVANRIQQMQFEESFDLIVAIANGGIIPAALINQRLLMPIALIKISFRDAKQQPIYDQPMLIEPLQFDPTDKKILLVEDRVKTGVTLKYAASLLTSAALVKTFAVNGNADYALFNENCFRFPWILA